MKLGYVVLYVNNPEESLKFWRDKFEMVEKGSKTAGPFTIAKVGFSNQDFSLELVPLELMKNNPSGLDLATPSIAFYVDDLASEHKRLSDKGVVVSEIADHGGIQSFAFSDNESRWFAVLQA